MSVMFNHVEYHKVELNVSNCDSNIDKYTCKYCDFTTDLFTIIKQHIQIHLSKKETVPIVPQNYICKNCGFMTHFILNWFKHVLNGCVKRREENVTNSECFITDQRVYFRKSTQIFVCDKCTYKTKRKSDLENHLIMNHLLQDHNYSRNPTKIKLKLKEPVKRRSPYKKSPWKTTRRSGKNLYEEILRRIFFSCDYCSYNTKTETDFKKHTVTHLERIQWLHCDVCDYKTTDKSLFVQHKSTVHDKIDVKSYQKGDLGSHETKQRLKDDKEKKDKKEKKRFKCDECGHVTKLKYDLKRHKVRKHLREDEIQWFACKECDYRTKIAADLRRHFVMKHLKDDEIRWFQCDKCDYRAKIKSGLKKHMRFRHSQSNV